MQAAWLVARASRFPSGRTSSWPATGSAARGCWPTPPPPAPSWPHSTRFWPCSACPPARVRATSMPEADALFEEHRPGLERLAYRMLGSLADADDVLQEAYLRWTRADRPQLRSARAYLYSVVTRLCIDQ